MLIPAVGQYVKCLLTSNNLVEGYVEFWDSTQVQLKSLDNKSILIINHPDDGISVIKIMLNEPQKETIKPELIKQENLTDLDKQFKQTYDQPSGDDLRTKKLAELRILQAEQEKKIVSEKLRQHHIAEVRKVTYGYPRFISQPSTK
jgi:hypothetical protein